MKEIKAYIKTHKLLDVTFALHHVKELTGMSVVDARGFGRSRAKNAFKGMDRGPGDYEPYAKIEVVCQDSIVDEIVSIIKKTAYTGLRGDGKIYISNIEKAIRIESGEEGEKAV
jgi:nitrogen regulatory protein P-II 1